MFACPSYLHNFRSRSLKWHSRKRKSCGNPSALGLKQDTKTLGQALHTLLPRRMIRTQLSGLCLLHSYGTAKHACTFHRHQRTVKGWVVIGSAGPLSVNTSRFQDKGNMCWQWLFIGPLIHFPADLTTTMSLTFRSHYKAHRFGLWGILPMGNGWVQCLGICSSSLRWDTAHVKINLNTGSCWHKPQQYHLTF